MKKRNKRKKRLSVNQKEKYKNEKIKSIPTIYACN